MPLLSFLLIRAVGPYKGSRSSSVSSVLQWDHSGPHPASPTLQTYKPPYFSNPILLLTHKKFSSHFPLNFFLNVRTPFGQFYSLSDVFFSHSLKNAYFWSVDQVWNQNVWKQRAWLWQSPCPFGKNFVYAGQYVGIRHHSKKTPSGGNDVKKHSVQTEYRGFRSQNEKMLRYKRCIQKARSWLPSPFQKHLVPPWRSWWQLAACRGVQLWWGGWEW